jgi:hypothetical protein
MMNAVLKTVASQGLRRGVAALVLAAAPLLYALPVGPMSYMAAWVSVSENQYGAIALGAGMQLGCFFIPLAPPVCHLLQAL